MSDRFKPRNDQLYGVTLMRAHRLAILAVCYQDVIHRLFHWDAHDMLVGTECFASDPWRSVMNAGLLQQQRQRHSRPFAAGCLSMCFLNGLILAKCLVCRAFDEV